MEMSRNHGGVFRRRRAYRLLDELATKPPRQSDPRGAPGHVRVLDGPEVQAGIEKSGPADAIGDEAPPGAGPPVFVASSGFHVRAVPIEQSFHEV
jgi:hypothetical protein